MMIVDPETESIATTSNTGVAGMSVGLLATLHLVEPDTYHPVLRFQGLLSTLYST